MNEEPCYCDANNIGEPNVSCGDCPRDYAQKINERKQWNPLTDNPKVNQILSSVDDYHDDPDQHNWDILKNKLLELASESDQWKVLANDWKGEAKELIAENKELMLELREYQD